MAWKLFRIILIETHNSCTRSCWFCKFGHDRPEPRTRMGWSTIERIINNLSSLNYSGRISWFLTNEPLLDTRMTRIIRATRQACPSAFLSLITNGDLLTNETYNELRDAGLDALGVSAYDDATLARVARIEDRRCLRIIDMRQPKSLRLENRGGNIQINHQYFDADTARFSTRGCSRPSTTMAVNVNGQVVLCCADLYGDIVMGDVHNESLESIWNGPGFVHYRQNLATLGRASLDLCCDCSHDGSSSRIDYPLQGQVERSVRQILVPVQALVRNRRAALREKTDDLKHGSVCA